MPKKSAEKAMRGLPDRLPEAAHTCRDVIALLTEYMEGSVAPSLARQLEDHLANCPSCEEFLATLGKTAAAVRSLRCEDIPRDCHDRLRVFLDRELKTGRT